MADRNGTNLTDQVVQALQEMISASGLQPGQQFAVEADLEKRLGVSRVVLREAVSRLRALGILQSKQGVGLIIGKPNPVALFRQAIRACAFDAVDLAQLGELRYAIEVGAVELAVKRATESQLARLRNLAGDFAAAFSGKTSDRPIDDIELAFHGAILEATHNPMLSQMHQVLAAYFVRSAREADDYLVDETTEKAVWEHQAIAEAFGNRNVEQARALLSGHLGSLLSSKYYVSNPGL